MYGPVVPLLFSTITKSYNEEIEKAISLDDQDKRLAVITDYIQQYARLRPFKHHNGDVFGLLLNYLLMKNGFCPITFKLTILDALSIQDLLTTIKNNIQEAHTLVLLSNSFRTPLLPSKNTTENELIKIWSKNYGVSLIEVILNAITFFQGHFQSSLIQRLPPELVHKIADYYLQSITCYIPYIKNERIIALISKRLDAIYEKRNQLVNNPENAVGLPNNPFPATKSPFVLASHNLFKNSSPKSIQEIILKSTIDGLLSDQNPSEKAVKQFKFLDGKMTIYFHTPEKSKLFFTLYSKEYSLKLSNKIIAFNDPKQTLKFIEECKADPSSLFLSINSIKPSPSPISSIQ